MKSMDILTGVDYAYRSHKHASARRVTVLETGVTGKVGSGFGTTSGLVKVAYVDGHNKGLEFLARPVQIAHGWAVEIQERADREAALKDAAEYKAAQLTKRAEQAFALHTALAAVGVEVKDTYVGGASGKVEALVAAGFEVGRRRRRRRYGLASGPQVTSVYSALKNLDTVFDKGYVSIEQALALLPEAVEADYGIDLPTEV